jgi:uncharacterized protein (TIGR00369 family)
VPDVENGTYLGCYVCGLENESGLKIPFRKTGEGASRADYVARPEHAGWPSIIHGGLIFTLMDEAVAWACTYAGRRCVTAKAEARFREPARVGMPLVITGVVTRKSGLALRARAEIHVGDETGPLLAELDAVMAVAKGEADGEDAEAPARA